MAENSGAQWVERFPGVNDLSALIEPFRDKAVRFVDAMRAAGMNVSITAVYRPSERAYLMHWSYAIANLGQSPESVPPMPGVDISWKWSGGRQAAVDMVNGYGIAFGPVLVSRHTQRLAIDMDISWSGTPTIVKADGSRGTILTAPSNGQNQALWQIGSAYGVKKLASDPPHWSNDGH